MVAINDMFRGKMGQTKVKRYRPGKAPDWAHDFDEDGDITLEKESADHMLQKKDDDPRLRRLAESRLYNREEVREDRRRIRQAEIVSTIEEESSRRQIEGSPELEEEDEDAVEERRTRTREKSWLQRVQEEAALMREEEEEAEDETDSEEEEEVIVIAMSKPVFVHKSERDTIAERERLEAKERAQKEAVKKKVEERRAETKQILVGKIQEIRKKMELKANINDDVDTNDDVNEAEEYAAWKVREIARIKRAREEAEDMLKEAEEEIKTVRNTTTVKERMECERRQPKQKRRRFLQKDYHRGSFFQTDPDDHAATAKTDSIYMRDFSAPTGEDKMDKTILATVMQVKCFGRRGGTKWTHLVNEDTTLQHGIYSCLNGLIY